MPFTEELGYLWSVWSGFTSDATFRHGFAMAGSSSSLRQALMAQWVTSLLPILTPIMSSEYTHQRLYWQDKVPGTSIDQEYVGVLDQQGEDDSGALPGQASALITWYSGLSGRSNRGRTFWPGVAAGQLVSGLLGASALTVLGDYATAMIAAFGPTATLPVARLGTISYQVDGVPRGPVLIETVDWFVRAAMGVRRKRANQAGGGP